MRQCLMQGPPASGGACWSVCTRVTTKGMVGAKVSPSSEGSRKLPRTGRQSWGELTHPAAPGLTTSSSPVTSCHTVSPLGAPDLAVISIRARRSPVGCTLQDRVTPGCSLTLTPPLIHPRTPGSPAREGQSEALWTPASIFHHPLLSVWLHSVQKRGTHFTHSNLHLSARHGSEQLC